MDEIVNKTNHEVWPIGQLPPSCRRPEIDLLRQTQKYSWQNDFEIIDIFEKRVADFAGSRFAVATDSCTNGLFLCLKYVKASGVLTIPARTYVSVPMQILHAGCQVRFENLQWSGSYQLKPFDIFDAATRWTKNMYQGGLQVVSFQIKKRLPIGRGGMILTDDVHAYSWLKKAVYDGRNLNVTHNVDQINMLGWHFYMTPEDAARGLLLMDYVPSINPDSSTHESYTDLSTFPIFSKNSF